MTVTENNRQQEFGATRTFTVRERSSDGKKASGTVRPRRKGEAPVAVRRPAPADSGIPATRGSDIREGNAELVRQSPMLSVSGESALPREPASTSHLLSRAEKVAGEEEAPRRFSSVQNKAALASMQMMKTRTTDLKIEDGQKRTGKGKEEPAEKVVSDEGGNTVVSVVKAIVYIIFVVIVSVALAVGIILVANDMYAFVKSDEAIEVTIPEYTTLDELATILHDRGVIRFPTVFKYEAVRHRDDQNYVAGTYTVTPMMNYDMLLDAFKEKEVTGTVKITIPEGYSTDEIISLFVDKYGIGTKEGFVDVIQNYEFDYWFVRELEEHGVKDGRIYRLDGYLFPDTYEFYLNSSELTVITKLLRRFAQIFTREYRNQCAELGFTVDEIVTLASMIEKEAAAPAEFFLVSSVFHNRLKMRDAFPRLESDATVVYAIAHDTGERTVDLYYDTPYNTYQYDGLPPGPIANPSASAMLAALTVTETPYYYFVSGMGTTFFSETKEEHDQHIAEIREAAQASGGELTNIPQIYVDPNPPKPAEPLEPGTDPGEESGGEGSESGGGDAASGDWWSRIDWGNPIFWGVNWDDPDSWSDEVREAVDKVRNP